MPILSEAKRAGEYVLPGHYTEIHNSRAGFTGSGVPGQVLGHNGTVYVPLNMAGADGSQTAVAILWDHQTAVTAKQVTVTNRGPCEVSGYDLTWTAGMTTNQIATAVTQLRTNSNIRVRFNT